MVNHTWKSGEKVIRMRRTPGGDVLSSVQVIHKVYKSGRFVLEQGGIQYRPDGQRAGAAGLSTFIEKYSDARVMELKKNSIAAKIRQKIMRIGLLFKPPKNCELHVLQSAIMAHRLKIYDLETFLSRAVMAEDLQDVAGILLELDQ